MAHGIKLNTEDIRHIAIFESLTGAITKDCIVEPDSVTFVVKEGGMGLAIGKSGANIEKVREVFGKRVELIEYSDNLEKFLKNIFYPARIKSVQVIERGGKKIASVKVEPRDRSKAIGKGGANIRRAKILVQRHYGIEDIVLT